MTNEFYFTSYDGKNRIFAKEWIPQEEPNAILMISHGMTEHIGRYARFAEFLNEYGILVVGPDHTGHGKSIVSEEDYGYFGEQNAWKVMVENLHVLRLLEQNAHPSVPVFLFGHSMGSFLARSYIMGHSDGLSGVLLCGTGEFSPAVLRMGQAIAALEEKKHGPRYRSERLQALCFKAYNKKFAPARTPFDWLTRDESMVDAYLQDPACGFVFTVSAFRALFGGLMEIQNRKNLAKILPKLPIFLLSGTKDPVGNNGHGVLHVAHALQDSGVRNVTVKLYTDCRHELLNELNYRQVYLDILTWMENQL